MRSEALYIVFLVAPWVLVVGALLFYRRRRTRKALEDGDGDRTAGASGESR